MDTIKRLLFGAAKLGLAFVFVAFVGVVAVWGYTAFRDSRTRTANASLGVKKDWPASLVAGKLNTEVATAWRDGRLYYQVTLSDFANEKFSVANDASLILVFSDADGFKLWQKDVPKSEATRVLDAANQPSGFHWAFDEYQSADEYRRAASLAIAWRGWAAVEKPAASLTPTDTPKPARARNKWRDLWIGISQADVIALLGEPTNVTTTASGSIWRYGTYSSPAGWGEIEFNRFLQATSWREP